MTKSEKILITGSTGFVGSNIVKKFRERNISVFEFSKSLGNDLEDPLSFNCFEDKNIDVVVHTAALTFVPDSWIDTSSYYAVNTLGTQHALEFCRKVNARMVYVSSYVYGIPQYLPIDEEHPLSPNNPYGHSKLLGELLCRFYSEQMDVKTVILRPFNLYGKGQDENFLIPTLMRQAKETGKITVNDETPRRDYIHISDFVEACLLALDYDGSSAIFNVGSGKSVSVEEIINIIIKASKKKVSWNTLGETRRNEIPDTVANCGAIEKALGWHTASSLENSIKDYVLSEFTE